MNRNALGPAPRTERIRKMTDAQDFVERRTHKRYPVRDGAFAALKGEINKLGQIMDISKGGLSFRYIDIGDRPKDTFEIDIYVESNQGFSLEGIPGRSMSDSEIVNRIPFSTLVMRRHGVRFEQLSQNHLTQLEYFIDRHAIDKV